jgi:hypothetical protein
MEVGEGVTVGVGVARAKAGNTNGEIKIPALRFNFKDFMSTPPLIPFGKLI